MKMDVFLRYDMIDLCFMILDDIRCISWEIYI